MIMSVWELSISAFFDVMSTHRNEELIVPSLEVTESDVSFGLCVLENEKRIYSRLIAGYPVINSAAGFHNPNNDFFASGVR